MFQCYYRILDQYKRSITAFAIFTDGNKAFHPKEYTVEFLGTGIRYWYNTYKIIDQDDEKLEASDNPFALAVLSAKMVILRAGQNDQQLFDQAYNLTKLLLIKQLPKAKVRKVLNFLRYYLRFENEEMFVKFEKEISNLSETNVTMGIDEFLLAEGKKEGLEEGLAKGVEKGRLEALKGTALKMKEAGLDTEFIAAMTGLPIYEIEHLS
jgi:predicted transposase/invertase (TIGR01784 family)